MRTDTLNPDPSVIHALMLLEALRAIDGGMCWRCERSGPGGYDTGCAVKGRKDDGDEGMYVFQREVRLVLHRSMRTSLIRQAVTEVAMRQMQKVWLHVENAHIRREID